MRVKYDNGGKTKKKKGIAQSDTLERSEEQAMENYNASLKANGRKNVYSPYPEKTYEEKLKEATARRKRNARSNASNARRAEQRPDFKMPKPLDETNLRNKDGSPLRGGPKATPIAPKEIPTKTPKKTLKKSKAVIPVPTKKEVRQARRKNRK
jgi:hypothetical protein